MIELLILYELSKKILTMYGISKEIRQMFSVLTTPSYGTLKPALNRLEQSGYVKSQKSMTSGGRPSTYYSITKEGVEELKTLLLAQPQDNPVQFLTASRIKLACAEVLDVQSRKDLFRKLKIKAETIMVDSKNILVQKNPNFYPKLVLDNLICEYQNFISLLEGFEKSNHN